MFLSIAIACGLITLISTVLVLATCWTSSQARRTTLVQPVPPLAAEQPQESIFTFANAATA